MCGPVSLRCPGHTMCCDRVLWAVCGPESFRARGSRCAVGCVVHTVLASPLPRGGQAAVDPWPWPPHAGWVTCLRVTIAEGKNQQIRKLCKRSNLHVRRLHRVSLGPQRLGDLAAGRCRVLDAAEVDALYAACAMDGL